MVARRDPRSGGNVLKTVTGSARSLKEQASDIAGDVGRAIKDETEEFFSGQKGKVAARIENIGSMIEKAGRVLHAGKIEAVAEYVDMAAETAEQASRYLEDHDVDEIAQDAGEFVKRHPAVIFASVLVLGLAVGRFIKAGQEE